MHARCLKKMFAPITMAALAAFAPTLGAAESAVQLHPTGLVSVPVYADIGAAERIRAASRLRTMTHEASAVACHLNGNVHLKESHALARDVHEEFAQLSEALLNGSPKLNISGPETRAKTIQLIHSVTASWGPVDQALTTLLATPQNTQAQADILAQNNDTAFKTDQLVGQITAEYANPAELLFADAFLIDLVGRQSMLTQKMSQEFCAIWSGDHSDTARTALQNTVHQFEASMIALRDGNAALGLDPAATPKIKMLLDETLTGFQALLPAMDVVIEYGAASEETTKIVFDGLNDKMHRLEQIGRIYTQYAKHNIS